jgi:hypothetical protein
MIRLAGRGPPLACRCSGPAGRLDEARKELARLKDFRPNISLAWIEKNVPYTSGPMKSYLEGWRKVGLQ